MSVKKCKYCKNFDNERYQNDNITKHLGICVKMAQIVKENEGCKNFFIQKKELNINDIQVIEPVFILPEPNLPIQTIITFITDY